MGCQISKKQVDKNKQVQKNQKQLKMNQIPKLKINSLNDLSSIQDQRTDCTQKNTQQYLSFEEINQIQEQQEQDRKQKKRPVSYKNIQLEFCDPEVKRINKKRSYFSQRNFQKSLQKRTIINSEGEKVLNKNQKQQKAEINKNEESEQQMQQLGKLLPTYEVDEEYYYDKIEYEKQDMIITPILNKDCFSSSLIQKRQIHRILREIKNQQQKMSQKNKNNKYNNKEISLDVFLSKIIEQNQIVQEMDIEKIKEIYQIC
ncbi:hypothetical protein PPERSA_06060 [Pseudocohnilembus persalinus]|uniref:Uncharacterized protein n=1 Tax=Pseudocohnilembus persalinus TaxID=266149 RepID=A0A0V0QVC0_PSEPJ|nr:hypothetical protein PPERSA_06060 [Pseudocohnilembus persalinus]|eukprot:KRX06178.1 hypothetical protein PPERSA_06060 [Pseudocohnilembus persalinus]